MQISTGGKKNQDVGMSAAAAVADTSIQRQLDQPKSLEKNLLPIKDVQSEPINSKNFELLMTTLLEYDPVELENDIFTLNKTNDQSKKINSKEKTIKKM